MQKIERFDLITLAFLLKIFSISEDIFRSEIDHISLLKWDT